jgi:hypothetical protein
MAAANSAVSRPPWSSPIMKNWLFFPSAIRRSAPGPSSLPFSMRRGWRDSVRAVARAGSVAAKADVEGTENATSVRSVRMMTVYGQLKQRLIVLA